MIDLKQPFNFSQATLIKPIHCKKKKKRRLLESAVISKTNHVKQRPSFYKISPDLADIILHEDNIKIENGFKQFSELKHFSLNITILFRIISFSFSRFLLFSFFPLRHSIRVNIFMKQDRLKLLHFLSPISFSFSSINSTSTLSKISKWRPIHLNPSPYTQS